MKMKTLKTLSLSGLLALGFLSAGAFAGLQNSNAPDVDANVTVIFKTTSSAAS
jgi:hypothetical protein